MKYIRYGYHTYFYNLILDGQCRATLYRDIMKEVEISDEVTELKNYYGKYFSLSEYFFIYRFHFFGKNNYNCLFPQGFDFCTKP